MKKLSILGVILILLLSACKSGRTDEENIQKLLDRQAEIQEQQEESVDQLQILKDSLSQEKRSLLDQRQSRDSQIRLMEETQQALVDSLKEKEASVVESEKNALELRISEYEDSIRVLRGELEVFDSQLDSLEQRISFYEVQEDRTEEYLESGIAEIDQQMTSREKRKEQEIKKLDLLRKRVLVADKKIEAYDLEKQMYVNQRDELLRANASEERKAPYLEKIAALDSIIMAEQNNKSSIENEIQQAEDYIAETDVLMNELQEQVQSEYERKDIIETFIAAEKERLSKELEQITQSRQELLAQQTTASENLQNTEKMIGELEKNAELIRNKEMSDILEMQALIEQSEADLAQEEITMLEDDQFQPEDLEAMLSSDPEDTALVTLLSLGNQLDSLNSLIQEEKTEIAKTRMELAQKRAEVAQKRASFARTAGTVVILLVIAGIALLTLFYYLGKRSRSKS
jgi:hypothetical protein